jgi:hypothetical protein
MLSALRLPRLSPLDPGQRPDWLTPDVILIVFLPALVFEGGVNTCATCCGIRRPSCFLQIWVFSSPLWLQATSCTGQQACQWRLRCFLGRLSRPRTPSRFSPSSKICGWTNGSHLLSRLKAF